MVVKQKNTVEQPNTATADRCRDNHEADRDHRAVYDDEADDAEDAEVEDARSKPHCGRGRVWIFLVLGSLMLALSVVLSGIYVHLRFTITSIDSLEVIPSVLPAAVAGLAGWLVALLFWRRVKILIYAAVTFCTAAVGLSVVAAVFTSTHLLQPLLRVSQCQFSRDGHHCLCTTHSISEKLPGKENNDGDLSLAGMSGCEDLYHLVPGLLFTMIGIQGVVALVCLLAAMISALVYRSESMCPQHLDKKEQYSPLSSVIGEQHDIKMFQPESLKSNEAALDTSMSHQLPAYRNTSLHKSADNSHIIHIGNTTNTGTACSPAHSYTGTACNPAASLSSCIKRCQSFNQLHTVTSQKSCLSNISSSQIVSVPDGDKISQNKLRTSGQLKEHRKRGRRAVTLNGLDQDQLLLILRLQMRYQQESEQLIRAEEKNNVGHLHTSLPSLITSERQCPVMTTSLNVDHMYNKPTIDEDHMYNKPTTDVDHMYNKPTIDEDVDYRPSKLGASVTPQPCLTFPEYNRNLFTASFPHHQLHQPHLCNQLINTDTKLFKECSSMKSTVRQLNLYRTDKRDIDVESWQAPKDDDLGPDKRTLDSHAHITVLPSQFSDPSPLSFQTELSQSSPYSFQTQLSHSSPSSHQTHLSHPSPHNFQTQLSHPHPCSYQTQMSSLPDTPFHRSVWSEHGISLAEEQPEFPQATSGRVVKSSPAGLPCQILPLSDIDELLQASPNTNTALVTGPDSLPQRVFVPVSMSKDSHSHSEQPFSLVQTPTFVKATSNRLFVAEALAIPRKTENRFEQSSRNLKSVRSVSARSDHQPSQSSHNDGRMKANIVKVNLQGQSSELFSERLHPAFVTEQPVQLQSEAQQKSAADIISSSDKISAQKQRRFHTDGFSILDTNDASSQKTQPRVLQLQTDLRQYNPTQQTQMNTMSYKQSAFYLLDDSIQHGTLFPTWAPEIRAPHIDSHPSKISGWQKCHPSLSSLAHVQSAGCSESVARVSCLRTLSPSSCDPGRTLRTQVYTSDFCLANPQTDRSDLTDRNHLGNRKQARFTTQAKKMSQGRASPGRQDSPILYNEADQSTQQSPRFYTLQYGHRRQDYRKQQETDKLVGSSSRQLWRVNQQLPHWDHRPSPANVRRCQSLAERHEHRQGGLGQRPQESSGVSQQQSYSSNGLLFSSHGQSIESSRDMGQCQSMAERHTRRPLIVGRMV